MNTLDGLPILTHYKSLLTTENQEDAHAVLKEFFEYYSDTDPKEHLWFILVNALTNESEEIQPRHRSEMIFFYEYCLALLKAAQTLSRTQPELRTS